MAVIPAHIGYAEPQHDKKQIRKKYQDFPVAPQRTSEGVAVSPNRPFGRHDASPLCLEEHNNEHHNQGSDNNDRSFAAALN